MLHPRVLEQETRIETSPGNIDRQNLNPEVRHFVDGAVAGAHPNGRRVGIVDVLIRVVIDVMHVQHRSTRKRDGSAIAVYGLAVDVPAGNANEPRLLPAGQDGPRFELAAEVMRVGIDAQDLDVDRQTQLILHNEIAIAGGNVELVIAVELQQHRMNRRWLVSEIQANLRVDDFRLAAGLQVHIEDEVVARIEAPRHSGWLHEHGRVRFPEQKMAVGIESVAAIQIQLHARHSVLPVIGVGTAERCGAIDEHVGMVDELQRPGQDLHGADEVGLGERIGQDEVAKHVGAGRGKRIRALDGENEVGLPDLPGCVVMRGRRRLGPIALGRSGLDPFANQGQVLVAETTVAGEIAVAGSREPGRHVTRLRDVEDLVRVTARVSPGEQAEGSGSARVMAHGAVAVDDGCDLAAPCDRSLRSAHGGWRSGQSEDGAGCQGERSGEENSHGSPRGTMEQPIGGPPGGGMGWFASSAWSASSRSCLFAEGRSCPSVR